MSQSDAQTPPAPEAPDQGEVVVLNRDLFFGVRIGNTLRALGYRVSFVPDAATLVEKIQRADQAPVLGVIDMGAGVDWGQIRGVTSDPGVLTPLLAFGSHMDVEGLRAAKAAGVTRVVSNGDFHRGMVDLVRRYALPPSSDCD